MGLAWASKGLGLESQQQGTLHPEQFQGSGRNPKWQSLLKSKLVPARSLAQPSLLMQRSPLLLPHRRNWKGLERSLCLEALSIEPWLSGQVI